MKQAAQIRTLLEYTQKVCLYGGRKTVYTHIKHSPVVMKFGYTCLDRKFARALYRSSKKRQLALTSLALFHVIAENIPSSTGAYRRRLRSTPNRLTCASSMPLIGVSSLFVCALKSETLIGVSIQLPSSRFLLFSLKFAYFHWRSLGNRAATNSLIEIIRYCI